MLVLTKFRPHLGAAFLILLALLTWPFFEHGLSRAFAAWAGDAEARGRLWHDGAVLANLSIFAHMATGAVITLLVPLQLLPVIRRRWPLLHRGSGYVLVSLSILTGFGGLIYIALKGTIGGPWMSGWFALYGLLMIGAAIETLRHARAKRFDRHQRWALRLLVLAIGSYLYRVHYGLWFSLVGRVGVQGDFRGAFDLFNVWGFFLPYLIGLELWFYRLRRRARALAS